MARPPQDDDQLFFQDLLPLDATHGPQHEGQEDDRLSLAFFELANVNFVWYRLTEKRKKPMNVVVKQDTGACGEHTGGIVWETSYLLINYLLSRQQKLGRTLEVGAGCGLLGIVLAASGLTKHVVLTETTNAMDNLLQNIQRNKKILVRKGKVRAVGHLLDWNHPERDSNSAHPFDTIVGTDVIFSPFLVEPLLRTLLYRSHESTVVYLCLQVRCPDSHQLLLKKAKDYQWEIEDLSTELASIAECAWGLQMECMLLRLTRIKETSNTTRSKKRKSNRNDKSSKKQR